MADPNSSSVADTSNSADATDNASEYMSKKEADVLFKQIRELNKELKAIKAAKAESSEKEAPETPSKGNVSSSDPEKAELQAQVKESQKQLKLLLKERDETKAREKELNWHKQVDEQLLNAGFDAKHLKFAKAYLKTENLVKYDDEGNLTMNAFDLSDGVKQWAGTDEAKLFMSAKNTNGSGTKQVNPTPKFSREKNGRPVVNWDAIANQMSSGDESSPNDGGMFAPPFQTK
jgi:hypothetical protein